MQFVRAVVGAAAVLLAGSLVPDAAAESRAVADLPPGAIGPFQIVNQADGRCMESQDRIRMWDCYGRSQPAQLWYLVRDGRGRYQLANGLRGDCMAGWAQGPNGWSVWTARCDSTFTNVDQLWYVHPADSAGPGLIRNLYGRALEPEGGVPSSNGTRIEIWDYRGTANQLWNLRLAM